MQFSKPFVRGVMVHGEVGLNLVPKILCLSKNTTLLQEEVLYLKFERA